MIKIKFPLQEAVGEIKSKNNSRCDENGDTFQDGGNNAEVNECADYHFDDKEGSVIDCTTPQGEEKEHYDEIEEMY